MKWEATAQNAIDKMREAMLFMKSGRQYRFTAKEIRPGRSTGPHSQSAHFNGHVQQICEETGNDFAAVKMYIKHEAMAIGWPHNTLPNGDALPVSETDVDTKQCAAGIEACHILAGDLGIILKED